jgi:hypothetical protein
MYNTFRCVVELKRLQAASHNDSGKSLGNIFRYIPAVMGSDLRCLQKFYGVTVNQRAKLHTRSHIFRKTIGTTPKCSLDNYRYTSQVILRNLHVTRDLRDKYFRVLNPVCHVLKVFQLSRNIPFVLMTKINIRCYIVSSVKAKRLFDIIIRENG